MNDMSVNRLVTQLEREPGDLARLLLEPLFTMHIYLADLSGSMRGLIDIVSEAINKAQGQLLEQSAKDGRDYYCAVIAFNYGPWVVQPLMPVNDRSITLPRPESGTALYMSVDMLNMGLLRALAHTSPGARGTVIAYTDGADEDSDRMLYPEAARESSLELASKGWRMQYFRISGDNHALSARQEARLMGYDPELARMVKPTRQSIQDTVTEMTMTGTLPPGYALGHGLDNSMVFEQPTSAGGTDGLAGPLHHSQFGLKPDPGTEVPGYVLNPPPIEPPEDGIDHTLDFRPPDSP